MLHCSIRFPLENTSLKIKLLRISRQWDSTAFSQAQDLSECGALYDCTGCTPMKLALKKSFHSTSSHLPGMSAFLLTSSLNHFLKQCINTRLYSSLLVGMPRSGAQAGLFFLLIFPANCTQAGCFRRLSGKEYCSPSQSPIVP